MRASVEAKDFSQTLFNNRIKQFVWVLVTQTDSQKDYQHHK